MGKAERIYGERIDLSASSIKEFYDRRADKCIEGKKSRYTTVLLGDSNPEYAEKWNEFEKDFIIPHLNIGANHQILDIGCGVGRWAENISSACQKYIGTDFSNEMIKAAKEHFKGDKKTLFINDSFQDIFTNDVVSNMLFDTVIIAGVSMYINDTDLKRCYSRLTKLLGDGAVVYMEESVGINERLTLNHIWSENLGDNYNAIYRTRDEYLGLLEPLLDYSEILQENYFEQLDKTDMIETSHWYILLKKR